MKPHLNMSDAERKAYLHYVFNNELTPEEIREYCEYLGDTEDESGCNASVVPLEVIRQGREATDAYYEKFLEERERKIRSQS
jgi:hypothetical protein